MGSIVRRSAVFGALFFGSALVDLCATRPITETGRKINTCDLYPESKD
jgi:hypothetical protein